MSLVQIMAILALERQVFPVQRYLWVIDVFRRQQNLVMDDVARPFPADFAHAAVDLNPVLDVTGTAAQPEPAVEKFLCPGFSYGSATALMRSYIREFQTIRRQQA